MTMIDVPAASEGPSQPPEHPRLDPTLFPPGLLARALGFISERQSCSAPALAAALGVPEALAQEVREHLVQHGVLRRPRRGSDWSVVVEGPRLAALIEQVKPGTGPNAATPETLEPRCVAGAADVVAYELPPAAEREEQVPLISIISDPELQPRVKMSGALASEYAEVMREDAGRLPPVELVETDRGLLLCDGFHRMRAASEAGLTHIHARIVKGGRRDALIRAAGANRRFDRVGQRRTNADKRRAVRMLLGDPELSLWNDSELGRVAGVDAKTVVSVRTEMAGTNAVIVGSSEDARLVQRGGSEYLQRKPRRNRARPKQEAVQPSLASVIRHDLRDLSQRDGIAKLIEKENNAGPRRLPSRSRSSMRPLMTATVASHRRADRFD